MGQTLYMETVCGEMQHRTVCTLVPHRRPHVCVHRVYNPASKWYHPVSSAC